MSVGGVILRLILEPKTVSRLWEETQKELNRDGQNQTVTYKWFILALDFLFLIGVIEIEHGLLRKQNR